jgi:hypothetical protein
MEGSALLSSWYTNLLSALIIVLAGEGGSVRLVSVGLVNTRMDGGTSPAATFVGFNYYGEYFS